MLPFLFILSRNSLICFFFFNYNIILERLFPRKSTIELTFFDLNNDFKALESSMLFITGFQCFSIMKEETEKGVEKTWKFFCWWLYNKITSSLFYYGECDGRDRTVVAFFVSFDDSTMWRVEEDERNPSLAFSSSLFSSAIQMISFF